MGCADENRSVMRVAVPSLTCKIGMHRGNWDYVGLKDCRQIRICQGCGNQGYRIRRHEGIWELEEWLSKDDFIRKSGVCKRCNVRLRRSENVGTG